METHKLTQDEWDSLLDEEKIPLKQEPKKEPELDWDPSTRGYSIAREALKTINGERQDKYGDPEDNFKVIADMWTAYLRALTPFMSPLTKDDIANMMCLLKISRIVGGEYHRDNDVDLVGYALLGADIRGGQDAHD